LRTHRVAVQFVIHREPAIRKQTTALADRRNKGRRAHAVLAEARWRSNDNDNKRDKQRDNEREENEARRGACPAALAVAAVRRGAVGARGKLV
jgi:hypothetical protein